MEKERERRESSDEVSSEEEKLWADVLREMSLVPISYPLGLLLISATAKMDKSLQI